MGDRQSQQTEVYTEEDRWVKFIAGVGLWKYNMYDDKKNSANQCIKAVDKCQKQKTVMGINKNGDRLGYREGRRQGFNNRRLVTSGRYPRKEEERKGKTAVIFFVLIEKFIRRGKEV